LGQLLALVVFLVGPSGGSIDDDSDGQPDIPVVVTTSPAVEESRFSELPITAAGSQYRLPIAQPEEFLAISKLSDVVTALPEVASDRRPVCQLRC